MNKIKEQLRAILHSLVVKREMPESADMMRNGESRFASAVIQKSEGKVVIFDVGANIGDYTKMTLEILEKLNKNDYEIHVFEPQPKCYNKLRAIFDKKPNIIVNNFALSDTTGEAVIHTDFEGSTWGSMYDRKGMELKIKTQIHLRTLSDYVSEQRIHRVDLLKIDTEGNEKKVLMGCGENLRPDVIKAIQFEYGGCYIDAGITLREIATLLLGRGYYVGRILSTGVAYKAKIAKFIEDYTYSNYAALAEKI